MMTQPETPAIELLARRLLCENSVFNVYLDRIADHNGNEVPDFVTVSPKNLDKDLVTGVAMLPVRDGRIGLIHIWRHPLGRASWEAPKGFVDANEDYRAAALRELAEETGMTADRGNFVDLGVIAPDPGLIRARVRLFALQNCTPPAPVKKKDLGHGELAFFTRGEIQAMLETGEIEESCTQVAAYRFLSLPDLAGKRP